MAEVVILGAGMAGLTAARALAERGVSVCVLEAREHVGGRVMSQPVEGGDMVELGAEFVHGRPAELWALIEEAGIEAVEREGASLREGPDGGLANEDPEEEEMFAPLEGLKEFAGEDVPFAEWLDSSDVPGEERQALVGYVEGFNAADARRISVRALGAQQKAEDATEGDRMWHLPGGYTQLAEYLAKKVSELGGEVRLGWEVRGVRWSEGRVEVETSRGAVAAEQCVVTLPLGVLQRVNRASGVRMEPEPLAVAQARRLAMGQATRFTMVFRERWWERAGGVDARALRELSFLFTFGRMPPVWWTAHPEQEALPTLTGWVGGPRAAALAGKTVEELGSEACALLAEVFGIGEDVVREALVGTYTHDWASDPLALGAYSYVPVGAMDAPDAMGRPEAGTMFFAGEHTDVTGHWGTVHAAIRSGLRAAAQAVE